MVASLLTGLLAGLSYPLRIGHSDVPNLGWLAWVAFVPLFINLRRATPREAFCRTFAAAATYHLFVLYWLYIAMHHFGDLHPIVSLCLLLLMVFVLSACISVAMWWTRWVALRWEREPSWLLPTAWVAMEFLLNAWPFGGFPWMTVAQTQAAFLPIIQITDVTGVYGLSFVIIWTNWWIATMWSQFRHGEWDWWVPSTFITVGLWIVLLGYGTWRFATVERQVATWPSYRVALLQGNIPQEEKWREGLAQEQMDVYIQSIWKLLQTPLDLVIWPEASYPYLVESNFHHLPGIWPVGGNVPKIPWPMLVGGVATEGEGTARRLYNSAFAIDPSQRLIGRYDKTHLVPFGEYIPYQGVFAFARKLAAPIGNFQPGKSAQPLQIGSVAVGPLICYEDIFPDVARAHVRRGAHFLANMTNDAWYGWSGAAEQHIALSIFRAVETRRYLVRATNTGVSGVIDPTGRAIIRSRLFEPAVIVARIRLGSGQTVYARWGDWFAYGCAACVGGMILFMWWRSRRSGKRRYDYVERTG